MSDFQRDASWQGRHFDEHCRFLLTRLGFKVGPPFVVGAAGVELDASADLDGLELWCEFKGSYQGSRPGLRRTDTTKKAIANGALLASAGGYPPFVILTSHLPAVDSAGARMLDVAKNAGYVADVVHVADPDDVARFHRSWTA